MAGDILTLGKVLKPAYGRSLEKSAIYLYFSISPSRIKIGSKNPQHKRALKIWEKSKHFFGISCSFFSVTYVSFFQRRIN